jgi:hypothetical protein
MAGTAVDQPVPLDIEPAVDDRRDLAVLRVRGLHDVVQPGDHPGRRDAFHGQHPRGVPQPDHRGRGLGAVSGHVTDREAHPPVGQDEHVVPVPAETLAGDGGPVAGGDPGRTDRVRDGE